MDRLLMRYLVLSDVHANLEALEAVLGAGRAWTKVLVLGDLVGYGADPNAVVERVRALPIAAMVRGNHDKVATGLAPVDSFNPVARQAIGWTTRALTPGNHAWLAALPEGPTPLNEQVEICHGAPHDEDFYVFDELDAQRASASLTRPVCLFGHTHVACVFRVGNGPPQARIPGEDAYVVDYAAPGKALVNCGAVGQPRDGDPRAAYGILDTSTRTVTLTRVAYDIQAAQSKILAAGLPPSLATRLGVGR
jgi:diadenosine tetraphosphatase ApaH/serine/threonine PP2A family protein phosphatase